MRKTSRLWCPMSCVRHDYTNVCVVKKCEKVMGFHRVFFLCVTDRGQPHRIRRNDLREHHPLDRWRRRLPHRLQVQNSHRLPRRGRAELRRHVLKSRSRRFKKVEKWGTNYSRKKPMLDRCLWLCNPSRMRQSWWKKCRIFPLSLRALVAYICTDKLRLPRKPK